MAKTIKFNLICDNKPIRTIEDLQKNFSIEDVLAYYHNGLLERWLNVRGYSKKDEKYNISKITCKGDIDIITELIKIFDVSKDENEIKESLYILKYLKEKQDNLDRYNRYNSSNETRIQDYKKEYDNFVTKLQNASDISAIKSSIKMIADFYFWLFELNHRSLFWKLRDTSPLAIMCLLMNEKTRDFFLPIENKIKGKNIAVMDINTNTQDMRDKKEMYNSICDLINSSDFVNKMGNNLYKVSKVTDGYWSDIEPKGKKYMIIDINRSNTGKDFVRSAGVKDGDLSQKDIKNKFVILDGIDYKSNSSSSTLYYMEV